MKKLKNFNTFNKPTNDNFNESFLSSIDSYLHNKITTKYMDKIKKEIDSMDDKEKISFVEKLIEKKKQQQGRNWLYFTVPIIVSLFSFGTIVTSPLLIAYFTIQYLNINNYAALNEYKKELKEIENVFKKEIDLIK